MPGGAHVAVSRAITGRAAVLPPSPLRAREETTQPAVAGGDHLLPRCGRDRIRLRRGPSIVGAHASDDQGDRSHPAETPGPVRRPNRVAGGPPTCRPATAASRQTSSSPDAGPATEAEAEEAQVTPFRQPTNQPIQFRQLSKRSRRQRPPEQRPPPPRSPDPASAPGRPTPGTTASSTPAVARPRTASPARRTTRTEPRAPRPRSSADRTGRPPTPMHHDPMVPTTSTTRSTSTHPGIPESAGLAPRHEERRAGRSPVRSAPGPRRGGGELRG